MGQRLLGGFAIQKVRFLMPDTPDNNSIRPLDEMMENLAKDLHAEEIARRTKEYVYQVSQHFKGEAETIVRGLRGEFKGAMLQISQAETEYRIEQVRGQFESSENAAQHKQQMATALDELSRSQHELRKLVLHLQYSFNLIALGALLSVLLLFAAVVIAAVQLNNVLDKKIDLSKYDSNQKATDHALMKLEQGNQKAADHAVEKFERVNLVPALGKTVGDSEIIELATGPAVGVLCLTSDSVRVYVNGKKLEGDDGKLKPGILRFFDGKVAVQLEGVSSSYVLYTRFKSQQR